MPLITNISKCSVNDGPGIRTVVYLKGCNLRCKWCHNPEGLSFHNEISYFNEKCIGCGRCIDICPEHHVIKDGKMEYIRENCTLCGKCTDNCPTQALVLTAKEMSVDEVFDEIKKDVNYYLQSGGGVTVSGGECLLAPGFIEELFKKCHSEKIHTAIETALFVPWKNIERVIEYTDLFFADLKLSTREKHIYYTGHDNDLILDNMKKLINSDSKVIIRIPLIPGVNDTAEEMTEIAKTIDNFNAENITVELLKYNYMAEKKYIGLDKKYNSFGKESQSHEKIAELAELLKEKINGSVIVITD